MRHKLIQMTLLAALTVSLAGWLPTTLPAADQTGQSSSSSLR